MMMIFIDKPDDVETELEARIRKLWKRPRRTFDVVTVREAAQAVRWGHPR